MGNRLNISLILVIKVRKGFEVCPLRSFFVFEFLLHKYMPFIIFHSMKTSYLLKIILLALPFIILVYVFLIRDRIDAGGGIGGGSYDLTKIYTLVIVGLYLLILNLVLAVQDVRQNMLFLLLGVAQLIVTIIMFVRSF